MGKIFNPDEREKLTELSLTLKLRKSLSCLIFTGVDSESMLEAFHQYLEDILGQDGIYRFVPSTRRILHDIICQHQVLPLDKFLIISLYETYPDPKRREEVASGFRFYQDAILEYNLKLIFLIDNDFLRYISVHAYDFFSKNHFACSFHQHASKTEAPPESKDVDELALEFEACKTQSVFEYPGVLHKLWKIVRAVHEAGNFDLLLDCGKALLKAGMDAKDDFHTAEALSHLAIVYGRKEDLEGAARHHKAALDLYKKLGCRPKIVRQMCSLALLYYDTKESDMALKYHEEALRMSRHMFYKRRTATQFVNMAMVFVDKGDVDSALNSHQKALDIYQDIDYRQGIIKQLNNLGRLHQIKGNYDRADACFTRAVDISRTWEDIQPLKI